MINNILFIFCIIFLLIYFYVKSQFVNLYPQISNYEHVTYSHFLQHAKNGDLLFLSGKTEGENMIKWYIGCEFSHVGILCREYDIEDQTEQVYIWESDIGQRAKLGCRVMFIEDKLSKWKGHKIACWKQLLSNNITNKQMDKTVSKHINKTIDSACLSYFFKQCKDKGKVFCSELVALSLQDLGIIDKDIISYHCTPKTFLNNKINYNIPYSNIKYFYF
jgi:hypothetical protein